MRKILFMLLTVLAVIGLPASGFCATELSAKQIDAIQSVRTSLQVVDDLSAKKLITPDETTAAENMYLEQVSKAVGHPVSKAEFQNLVAAADQSAGYSVFWSIALVFGGLLIAGAAIGLFAYFFAEIIPPGAYEFLGYAGAVVVSFGAYLFPTLHVGPAVLEPLWFVIPGAIAFAGCVFLTHRLHFNDDRKSMRESVYAGPGFINFPTVLFGICTAAWGFLAIFYNNMFPESAIPTVLAFGSMMALQAALGFNVITMPGCVAMGWKEEAQIPRSVFASFIILIAYLGLKLSGNLTGGLAIFESGAAFMGAFVYYLGLLILSNEWYIKSGKDKTTERTRYWTAQTITVASGVAAFYLGSVFHLPVLLGIGGTFFTLWLLEKYYELPIWKNVPGFLFSILLLGLFIFFFRGFAMEHSQYFLWGIK